MNAQKLVALLAVSVMCLPGCIQGPRSSPPIRERTCEQLGRTIIKEKTAGATTYRWCVSTRVSGSIRYEAKRDSWIFQSGRLTYSVSDHYDCQVLADKNAMPIEVVNAVCPSK